MKDSIWNHNPAKLLKECKRLRALCSRIISGEETTIQGSQKMGQYRIWMKEEKNPEWEIFALVNSKCVHLPIGNERKHWNPASLKSKDFEIDEIETTYRSEVIEAAEKIRDEYNRIVEQDSDGNAEKPPGVERES